MRTVEGFRLSPQQRRLWQLRQAGGDSAYRTRGAALIEGPLDQKILRAALQRLVARHEILRTTFHTLPGMSAPLQVITDGAPRFDEHDLTGLTPREQEAKLETLFRESGAESFALESAPPVSFSLARLSARRHLLLLSFSSLCADRGTLTSGVRQLAAAYKALSRGAELSGEPAQYADVAVYLNDLLESEETKAGRTFWQKKLAAATHDLKLPSERDRTGRPGFEPRVIASEVEPQTAARLAALACGHEVPPSVFLLTCWRVLLSRLTGREQVALGVACDGRTFEGAEDVLGPLARYAPVNIRVEDGARFGETMKAIEETSREASKWQEYFSWELAAADQQGQLHPAFGFDYEPRPSSYSAAGLTFTLVRQEACAESFKLRLSCFETPESWRTELHYDAGSFTAADAERLAEELHALARSAASAPATEVGELEIVGDAERRRLLVEWNVGSPGTELEFAL